MKMQKIVESLVSLGVISHLDTFLKKQHENCQNYYFVKFS